MPENWTPARAAAYARYQRAQVAVSAEVEAERLRLRAEYDQAMAAVYARAEAEIRPLREAAGLGNRASRRALGFQ